MLNMEEGGVPLAQLQLGFSKWEKEWAMWNAVKVEMVLDFRHCYVLSSAVLHVNTDFKKSK